MTKLTKKEISLAQNGKRVLGEKDLEDKIKNAELVFYEKNEIKIALPQTAVKVLSEVLAYISEGREISVVPLDEEFTTQKAADYLKVSRPFLIKLLEKGEIPYRKVGKHRRILFEDLQRYKNEIDEKRLKTLNELTAQAQELEMGY